MLIGNLLMAYPEDITESCESKTIQIVKEKGLRSLRGFQIFKYFLELKKCPHKETVKKITHEANQIQLEKDAVQSKRMQGFTSGLAYFTIAYILYLGLN